MSEGKGKAGKVITGAGVLVLLASLFGFGSFGFGGGTGEGAGNEGNKTTNTKEYQEEQPDQNPQEETKKDPTVTVSPTATAIPTRKAQESEPVADVAEVIVMVSGNKLMYNGTEVVSAKTLAEQIRQEYKETADTVLVKIMLSNAVYDTVEELKAELENKKLTYEIVEE